MTSLALDALSGQGWPQVSELALAFVLSATIGLEREIRQKSAGLRTHTLVGFGAALFMLVSKYGFHDTVSDSRVAAQVVSGIGFIGGGLIFVRRDTVRGLTTAAVIWLAAGVGMAAAGGLWLLAILATAGHYLVAFGLTSLAVKLPRSKFAPSRLRLVYLDGRGTLRDVLTTCTSRGFTIAETAIDQQDMDHTPRTVILRLIVAGPGQVANLTAALAGLDGVLTVASDDGNVEST
jgi:putative Mg2+ transporter-C (MgtC) family protein